MDLGLDAQVIATIQEDWLQLQTVCRSCSQLRTKIKL